MNENNLNRIATFGARLSQIHAPLHAAYLEYADPKGSDMDFVEGRMKEAAEKLEELAKQIRGWRG